MLSKKALIYLEITFKILDVWGNVRLGWNSPGALLTFPASKWRKFLAVLNFSVSVAYVVFLFARYIQLNYVRASETAAGTKLFVEFGLLAHLLPLTCCYMCVFTKEESFCSFFNQVIRYFAKLDPKETPLLKIRDKCLTSLLWSGMIVGGMHFALGLSKPHLVIFPSSLHEGPLMPWQRAIHCVLLIYIVNTWWSSILFIAGCLLNYFFATWSTLENLRSGNGCTSKELVKNYRCLQILQTNMNELTRLPLAFSKVLVLLLVIRTIYGSLTVHGPLRLLYINCSIVGIIFLFIIFRGLGEVYEQSRRLIHTSKARGLHNPWFRRVRRSFWPLKFEVGGMYFVDLPMSLTMASFILERTANMLVIGL